MSPYQQRVKRMGWAGGIYMVACPMALTYTAVGPLGWIVFASTAVVLYSLAVVLDAVYDSLRDKPAAEQHASHGRPAA